MNKQSYIWTAALVLVLSSCSNLGEENVISSKKEVREISVSTYVPGMTRAEVEKETYYKVYEANADSLEAHGFSLYAESEEGGSIWENASFTYGMKEGESQASWFSSTSGMWPKDEVSFYAIYVGGSGHSTELTADREWEVSPELTEDSEGMSCSHDLMAAYTTKTYSAGDASVDLEFKHILAQVQVKVSAYTGGYLGNVTLKNVRLSGVYNFSDGFSDPTEEDDVTEINLTGTSDISAEEGDIYFLEKQLMVIPTTKAKLSVHFSSSDYSVSETRETGEFSLVAGCLNTITVHFSKKDEPIQVSASVSRWDETQGEKDFVLE